MENQIKSVIESLLFISGEPVAPASLTKMFDVDIDVVKKLFKELQEEYEDKGINIREVSGKYQFVTNKQNYDYIKEIVFPAKERMLSPAALEVLAIIAYKQPITKPGIDSIRGIKSERIVLGLVEKGLVAEAGKSDAPGKPMQYKTTEMFLQKLNISSIKDLPPFSDGDDIMLEKPQQLSNQMELDI
jgi:segregation and condensation protein B